MHLHIEPEYLPEVGEKFDYFDNGWLVWHGTWSFLANVHWYTKTQDKTSPQFDQEPYADWHFSSRVLLKTGDRSFTSTCEEAIMQLQQTILTGRYQQYKDSPKEFTTQERTRVAEIAQTIQFKHPEYPVWAIPVPVAVFGDPSNYRTRVGYVFYPLSDDFGVEIFVDAWTQGSKPTIQELEQIHSLLTQQTVANL